MASSHGYCARILSLEFSLLLGSSRWSETNTIDEALQEAAENGTHSILDITHTAKQHEFAAAVPLAESRLLAVFGTTQPTRIQVEQHKDGILRELKRWEAVYFPVYSEGQARELALPLL